MRQSAATLASSVYLAFAISDEDAAVHGGPISAPVTGLVMSVLLPGASHARPGARLVPAAAGGPLPGGAPPERQSRPAAHLAPRPAAGNLPARPRAKGCLPRPIPVIGPDRGSSICPG